MLGSKSAFENLHDPEGGSDAIVRLVGRMRLSDAEAIRMVKRRYGEQYADEIASMPKPQRDAALHRLKDLGLSVRQIERLTGIGRGIIASA